MIGGGILFIPMGAASPLRFRGTPFWDAGDRGRVETRGTIIQREKTMRTTITALLCVAAVLVASAFAAVAGEEADPYKEFEKEEIKPFIKINKGPWVSNVVTGGAGDYRIAAKIPDGSEEFIVGIFDAKINRKNHELRSAVVLVDGVNPLNPNQAVALSELDTADVADMTKYALDGHSFTARDATDREFWVKVVDAKEEWDFGGLKPFAFAKKKKGKNLGRVDVFVFAAPAISPVLGETVDYGEPIARFVVQLERLKDSAREAPGDPERAPEKKPAKKTKKKAAKESVLEME